MVAIRAAYKNYRFFTVYFPAWANDFEIKPSCTDFQKDQDATSYDV